MLRVVQVFALVLTLSLFGMIVWTVAPNKGLPGTVDLGAETDSTTEDPHELKVTPVEIETPDLPDEFTPTSPSAPDAGDPMGYGTDVLLGPSDPSASELVEQFGLFVTGTVIEVLPAEWTNTDGKRPENPWKSVPEQHLIVTPVVIELDASPVVNQLEATLSPSERIVVAAYGGQVGQDEVRTNNPLHEFTVGERVLLGLSNHPYKHLTTPDRNAEVKRYETTTGAAWTIGVKYRLTEDGRAVSFNRHEPSKSTDEFISSLEAAASDT